MLCDTCGEDVDRGCRCQHESLLSFLSDFRSGTTAPEPKPEATGGLVGGLRVGRSASAPLGTLASPAPGAPASALSGGLGTASGGLGTVPGGLGSVSGPTEVDTGPEEWGPEEWEPEEWEEPVAGAPGWSSPPAGSSGSPEWAPGPSTSPAWSPPTWSSRPQPAPAWPPDGQPMPSWPPASRRRPWKEVSVFLAVLLVAGGILFVLTRPRSSNLASKPSGQILADTVAAARRAGSAHLEGTFSYKGQTVAISADLSSDGGEMRETHGSDSADMRVIGSTLYVRGSYGFLRMMGVPANKASVVQERWIEVPDAGMAAAEFTGPRLVDDLIDLSPPVQTLPANASGVVSLSGVIPDVPDNQGGGAGDTATLGVSRSTPYYPVSLTFSDPQTGSVAFHFSRWGEPLTLVAPSGAISVPNSTGSQTD